MEVDCSNCKHDYICCTKFNPILTVDEFDKFEEKKKVPLTENSLVIGYVYVLNKREGGSCIYLKNNLCSIYDKRPQACRKFSCIGRM